LSSDFEKYQLIQDHLRGLLSEEQEALFSKMLQEDTEFSELFEEEKAMSSLVKGVVKNEIAQEVKLGFDAEKTRRGRVKKGLIIGGVILIGILATILLFSEEKVSISDIKITSEPLSDDEFKPIDEIVKVKESPVLLNKEMKSKNMDSKVQVENHSIEALVDTLGNVDQSSIKEIADLKDEVVKNETKPESQVAAQKKESKTTPATNENPCENLNAAFDVFTEASCLFGEKGSIEIDASGGKEPLSFKLNKQTKEEGRFEDLSKGKYKVEVRDQNNCLIGKKEIALKSKRCQDVPLAFNPDLEEWTYETEESRVTLKILNRFGKGVFSSEGENPSWNGQNNAGEELKLDDYLFFVYKDGQVIDKGNVTLVRQ